MGSLFQKSVSYWLSILAELPTNTIVTFVLMPLLFMSPIFQYWSLHPGPWLSLAWSLWMPCILVTFAILLFHHVDKRCGVPRPRGCKLLGMSSRSNLDDEFDEMYTLETPPRGWRVKSLLIFPVKSCRAVELDHGEVISTGMRYDRQFSFAQLVPATPSSRAALGSNSSFWSFLTQREQPRLAQVTAELWLPDTSLAEYFPELPDVRSEGVILIIYPHQTSRRNETKTVKRAFKIPFNSSSEWISKNKCTWEPMKIWKDYPIALNLSTVIPQEFRDFLGIKHPLGLFRIDPDNFREVYRCAPRKESLGYQPVTGFADAYPLHILNVASVQDLGANLNYDLPKLSCLRFRPNIVLTGPKAYAEDNWKRIRIGGEEYHVSCRTVRCKMPNVHEETGEKHAYEPDFTLRKMRGIDKGAKDYGCLGMQAVPASEWGQIRVGDRIEVLETGEHHYVML